VARLLAALRWCCLAAWPWPPYPRFWRVRCDSVVRLRDLRPTRGECWEHPAWQPGQALIAAGGGADCRSAKNAAAPHGSIARRARGGAAAPLPRGGLTSGDAAVQTARGYAGGVRRVPRRSPTAPTTVGPGPDRQGCGACQRSSTRRRRVSTPSRTPRHGHRERSGTRPAASPSAPCQAPNGPTASTALRRGAGHSGLDRAASRPCGTAGTRASRRPARPGETSHRPACQARPSAYGGSRRRCPSAPSWPAVASRP
jgi:hypothetical protein